MEATATICEHEAALPGPANDQHADHFAARLEQARAADGGPGQWVHGELFALRELARAAGVEQESFRAALLEHALRACRPDPVARSVFSYMLTKAARELDSTAFNEAVEAGRWEL